MRNITIHTIFSTNERVISDHDKFSSKVAGVYFRAKRWKSGFVCLRRNNKTHSAVTTPIQKVDVFIQFPQFNAFECLN